MGDHLSHTQKNIIQTNEKQKFLPKLRYELKKNRMVYIMLIPVILFYIIFHYVPMYGVIIAWKEYMPHLGIFNSPWVGWINFEAFFGSYYFQRLFRNTFALNILDLIFGFPAPIILALLLNEVNDGLFKRTVQTVSYLPHFISNIVIAGMLVDFLSYDGLINIILSAFGVEKTSWLLKAGSFRTIYVASDIWKTIGWGSIVYLASLSNIDLELYNAAIVDGANRFQRALHITIPGILPTVVIMLILRLGNMSSIGPEKIILIYNPLTFETSDVISTFVYRRGILQQDYSFSTAVGLFNSVVNIIFLVAANTMSRRVTETSLW